MSLATLLLVAVGVSADAFAVAVGKGLGMRRLSWPTALRLAGAFGLAQGLMPVLGWLLASQLASLVAVVDHWVAFVLLAAVGGRMLRGAWSPHDDAEPAGAAIGGRELLVLAVATSIDALAVGISFAFLRVDIAVAAASIGAITFVLALAGVAIGQRAGARFRGPAEAVGGVVLIGIGTRILLSHLALV